VASYGVVAGGLLEGPARPRVIGPAGLWADTGLSPPSNPDPHFGRILAAYGGVFVAGSLAWGMLVDDFRPDRYDLLGASLCLTGVAVIMYAPREG
jgi:drug/metabolite transporter superfamily protein YnfA